MTQQARPSTQSIIVAGALLAVAVAFLIVAQLHKQLLLTIVAAVVFVCFMLTGSMIMKRSIRLRNDQASFRE